MYTKNKGETIMKFSKKNVVDILYILAFVSLFTFIFTNIATWIFGSNLDGFSSSFENLFRLSLILILVFSVLSVTFAIINFFVKKKLDWIEVALYIATIIVIIVFTILCKVKLEGDYHIFVTFLMSNFAEIGVLIILLVTKLLSMFAFKKEGRSEVATEPSKEARDAVELPIKAEDNQKEGEASDEK